MPTQSPHAQMTELLAILKKPMASFVFSRFSQAYPDEFSAKMEQHLKNNLNVRNVRQTNKDVFMLHESFVEHMDIQGVLQLIDKGWPDVFGSYPDYMHTDALILLENRHLWAHQKDFSLQQVTDSAKRLLATMKTTSTSKALTKIERLTASRHDYYLHIPLPK